MKNNQLTASAGGFEIMILRKQPVAISKMDSFHWLKLSHVSVMPIAVQKMGATSETARSSLTMAEIASNCFH